MDIKRKILWMLKEGYSQQQISEKFKEENIKPNSLSTIEKHLKNIRSCYKAKTLFHLAVILIQEEYIFEEIEEAEDQF